MNRLFRPVDIASLVFFRIVFGILAMAESMALLFWYHYHEHSYDPSGFQFRYYGFEWVRPFPEPFMSIFFFLLIAAAICIALGKWYRYAAPFFALAFIYSFLLEKTHYLNHGYLLCWLGVVMCFLPANRAFSLDVRKRPEMRRTTIPAWTVYILAFLMGVVYFYGGLAKINPDWLQAMPLKLWLQARAEKSFLGPILAQEWMAWFMSYGGLILDLFVVFFLLNRHTRIYAFAFVVFFHVTNALIFNIGIFPWLSIALTLLYFPPALPRRWVNRGAERVGFIRRWRDNWQGYVSPWPADALPIWQEEPKNHFRIGIVLATVALFHMTYPLRHHLIPGNVAWTEEGHRYSWRMMLRTKQGRTQLTVEDRETGETWVINPLDSLRRDQAYDVASHPDMLLQYAHHLRDMYEERMDHEMSVFAKVRIRLNGGNYADFIDTNIDLAEEEWSFFRPSRWILPQEEED